MKIAIIGAGNIGGSLAAQLNKAGHEVTISFSRDEKQLQQRAIDIGNDVRAGSVAEAVAKSDVVVLSCGWADIDDALAQAGSLAGKIVIDTTNQYTASGLVELPTSVAAYNLARMPGAQLVRAFNMFTADFQREVATGKHQPVAMFYAAEDSSARQVVEALIKACGFAPIYIGGWDAVNLIEAPHGIMLGKAYRPEAAQMIADTIREGNREKVEQLATTLAS